MNMKFIYILVALFFSQPLMAKTFAGAQVYIWSISRNVILSEYNKYNQDMSETVKHISPNDATNNGLYIGFVGGVSDSLVASGEVCPANDDQLSLFIYAVDEYIRKHPKPELYSQDPYDIVKKILIAQFGCHKK